MIRGKIKQLSFIIFLPIFLLFLSACDPEVDVPDYVTFMAHDNVINTAHIVENSVDFFIPGVEHNLDNRDFTGWYFSLNGEDVPFDFNDVGDTRVVHARYNVETVAIPVEIIIRDETNMEQPITGFPDMVGADSRNIPIENSDTVNGITIRDIIAKTARDPAQVQMLNRNLVWYYLEIDEEGNPRAAEEVIDIDSTLFRFVELQRLIEDGGIRVAAVNEVIWRYLVLDTGGGQINQADLDVLNIEWDEIADGVFQFRMPQGDPILNHINLPGLTITRPGMEAQVFRWEEVSVETSSEGERTFSTSETWTPAEFNAAFGGGRPMPAGNVNLTVLWRGETQTVIIDSHGGLPGVDIGDIEPFIINVGQPIRTAVFGAGFDLMDITDPYHRQEFSHWMIYTRDTDSNLVQTGSRIDNEIDPPFTGARVIYLRGVWENKLHNVDIRCFDTRELINTIQIEWNGSIIGSLLAHEPTREGFEFDNWRMEDGEQLGVQNMPPYDIVVYASWTLRTSNITLRTASEDERLDDVNLTSYLVGSFGFFESILEIMNEDIAGRLTRDGHTLSGWRMDEQGFPEGRPITYDMLLRGRPITLFAVWTPNVYTVHLGVSDTLEHAATLSHSQINVTFGQSIGNAVIVVRANNGYTDNATIIEWMYVGEAFNQDRLDGWMMPNRNIQLHAIVAAPPGDPEVTTSNIIIRDPILPGGERTVIQFIGSDISEVILNETVQLNILALGARFIDKWTITDAATGAPIETIPLFDGGNAIEFVFTMPNHNIILTPNWVYNYFEVSFDEDFLRDNEIVLHNFTEPLLVRYGYSIREALDDRNIYVTRIGYEFDDFTLLGSNLGNTPIGAQDVELRSSWTAFYISINVNLIGDVQGAGGRREITSFEFREGETRENLLRLFENNLLDGDAFIIYNMRTHDLTFEMRNLNVEDDRIIRGGLEVWVDFYLRHARSRLELTSIFDPRVQGDTLSWDFDVYVSHTVECIITFLSEIQMVGIPGFTGTIYLHDLGMHQIGGRFDGWRIGSLEGQTLEDGEMMFNQTTVLHADWVRSGEITIRNGNALFFDEEGRTVNTMTLTGINPGEPIRPILAAFVEAANGLNGEPIIQHPISGINARVFTWHGNRFYIRVFAARQIYGFSLVNDEWGVNVLYSQNLPEWDEDTEESEFTVDALVKNYTTTGLQHRAVTLENLHGTSIVGREITAITNQGDVVFPTFIAGQRVIAIASEIFGNNQNALNGLNSVTFPKYLIRIGTLRGNPSNASAPRNITFNFENMPWFESIPANFSRFGNQNPGNWLRVYINPITPLRTIGATAFINPSDGGNWALSAFTHVHMRGFQGMNASDVTWWNIRWQFLAGFQRANLFTFNGQVINGQTFPG